MTNDFKTASTIKAVYQARFLPERPLKIIFWLTTTIIIFCGICLLGIWILPFLPPAFLRFFSLPIKNIFLLKGIICLTFPLTALSALSLCFLENKIKKAGKTIQGNAKIDDNLLEYLDFEAASDIVETYNAQDNLFLDKLLFKLLDGNRLAFAFARLGIDKTSYQQNILAKIKADKSNNFTRNNQNQQKNKQVNYTDSAKLKKLIEDSYNLALAVNENKISIFILFLTLVANDKDFQKIMDQLQLQNEDVVSTVLWQMRRENYRRFRARFWERDNLRRNLVFSPVSALIGGYTVTLDCFSRDLSISNSLYLGGVVLHEQEIAQVEEILLKKGSHCLILMGETGSGRKSIIYNLANRIASETYVAGLKHLRFLELDMIAVIGGSSGREQLIARLKQIFAEAAAAGNVVLIIPQIHNYIGMHFGCDNIATVDISGILNAYTTLPNFRLIGITTYEGWHQSIETLPDIAALFTKIEVSPVSPDDALRVLKEEALRREKQTGIYLPLYTLKEIIKLCDYYIADLAFPQKAINLLNELLAQKSLQTGDRGTKRILTPADVDAFFSVKYQLPAGAAAAAEKQILLNLENLIHEGLVNQSEAVSELANALRRARADIKRRQRTIGNFLFLGPSGVGKTETAKQLARVYFGSDKKIIRLDMGEYQTLESIDKLIGTYQTPGYLTSAVRDDPFSLVLLDEIEKSHPNIINLFLAVLDEGQMLDGAGRKVDFRHIIIIATSNAGSDYIKDAVERGSSLVNIKDVFCDTLIRRGIFKTEFINRFDGVVLFRPLNLAEISKIAALMLNDIKKGLKEKRIDFIITENLCSEIAKLGFDPVWGGRALRRVIQEKVENTIAKAILEEILKPGDTFEIEPSKWQILINEQRAEFYAQLTNNVSDEINQEADILTNLEDAIHQGLVDQNEAVADLANALRRAAVELKTKKRPIGNFLFLGPSGVGKTETAKQLARAFFGSEKNMVRLDMGEYQTLESIDKLIGNLQTPGYFTTSMMENPKTVVLIDEIEKANPKILNLFLGMLDEGRITDGAGHSVDFTQSIIIATSNAGSQDIKEAIDKNKKLDAAFKTALINKLIAQGIFLAEFINRFDNVVLYKPLSQKETEQVAYLILQDIVQGLSLKGIELRLSSQFVKKISTIGFDPVWGGRALRRVIQEKVENTIASALLLRQIQRGDIIEIDPINWQVVILGKQNNAKNSAPSF